MFEHEKDVRNISFICFNGLRPEHHHHHHHQQRQPMNSWMLLPMWDLLMEFRVSPNAWVITYLSGCGDLLPAQCAAARSSFIKAVTAFTTGSDTGRDNSHFFSLFRYYQPQALVPAACGGDEILS